MSVLNRKRFKSEDDHYIFLCWEKLADAYSTGRGCTPNHEKAKEYYKYAVAAALAAPLLLKLNIPAPRAFLYCLHNLGRFNSKAEVIIHGL